MRKEAIRLRRSTPANGTLELEMALDEFAEFFAVFIAHVHEFDAAAVRSDIADNGGEMDLAETGPNFELDRVADTEFLGGFQIGAAQADGLYSSTARRCTVDVRTKRGVKWNSNIAARDDVAGTRLSWRSKRRCRLLERGTILDHRQRIFRCGAQASRFRIGETLTALGQGAKKLGGFRGPHAPECFNGLNAHILVTQNLMFTRGDFLELRHGRGFLRPAELIDHHGNDHGMRVGKDSGEYECGA